MKPKIAKIKTDSLFATIGEHENFGDCLAHMNTEFLTFDEVPDSTAFNKMYKRDVFNTETELSKKSSQIQMQAVKPSKALSTIGDSASFYGKSQRSRQVFQSKDKQWSSK